MHILLGGRLDRGTAFWGLGLRQGHSTSGFWGLGGRRAPDAWSAKTASLVPFSPHACAPDAP
eukprot:206895-Chlamydomonas_euryale.AAC.1